MRAQRAHELVATIRSFAYAPYSVIPHPTTPAVFQLAPMCQEWAEAIVQECHALCAGKK